MIVEKMCPTLLYSRKCFAIIYSFTRSFVTAKVEDTGVRGKQKHGIPTRACKYLNYVRLITAELAFMSLGACILYKSPVLFKKGTKI